MTHRDALANGRSYVFPGIDCPGELVSESSYEDRHLAQGGRVESRRVDVYRCAGCGRTVALAGEAVLNVYPIEAPAHRLVARLAEAFDVKPILPRGDE